MRDNHLVAERAVAGGELCLACVERQRVLGRNTDSLLGAIRRILEVATWLSYVAPCPGPSFLAFALERIHEIQAACNQVRTDLHHYCCRVAVVRSVVRSVVVCVIVF
jgi:hypothetical protein